MKNITQSAFVFYFLIVSLSLQAFEVDPVQIDSFIPESLFIEDLPGQDNFAWDITPAANGGYYLGGHWGGKAAIWHFGEADQLIWTKTFEGLTGNYPFINILMEDSQGNLIAVGRTAETPANNADNFVISYAPSQESINWIRVFPGNDHTRFDEVIELSNGDLLINGTQGPFGEFGGHDQFLLKLDPATGTQLNYSIFSLGQTDIIEQVVEYEDKLYFTGSLRSGGLGGIRFSLSSLDLDLENLNWNYVYPYSMGAANARLYGQELLIESDHIFALSHGSIISDNASDYSIQFSKVDLNGELIWSKNLYHNHGYNLTANQIISIESGFLLIGRYVDFEGQFHIMVIQVDKNGEIMGAITLDGDASFKFGRGFINEDRLILGGYIAQMPNPDPDLFIAKIKIGDGNLLETCDYIESIDIISQDIPGAAGYITVVDELTDTNMGLISQESATTSFPVNSNKACTYTIINSVTELPACSDYSIQFPSIMSKSDGRFTNQFEAGQISDNVQIKEITLYNAIGQIERQAIGHWPSWSASNFEPGTYIYNAVIQCDGKRQLISGKLIIMN